MKVYNCRMLLLLLIVFCCNLSDSIAEECLSGKKPFDDVAIENEYCSFIESGKQEGWLEGYADGFKPDNPVTRAEALKIIFNAKGISIDEAYGYKKCFSDVNTGEWYDKYVCYSKEEGYVKGYTGLMKCDESSNFLQDPFCPNRPVAFREAIKMALEIMGNDVEQCWHSMIGERDPGEWDNKFFLYLTLNKVLEKIPNNGLLGKSVDRKWLVSLVIKIRAINEDVVCRESDFMKIGRIDSEEGINVRDDAGRNQNRDNFSYKEEQKIDQGAYIPLIGAPIKGEKVVVDNEEDDTWHLAWFHEKLAFIHNSAKITTIHVEFPDYSPLTMWNNFGWELHPENGFDKSFLGLSRTYLDNGNVEKKYYLKPDYVPSFYLYKNKEHFALDDTFSIFNENESNCIFSLGNSQVCCENDKGAKCHSAFSGGGRWGQSYPELYNNPEEEWHENGPVPRGTYLIEDIWSDCKATGHWTCISFLLTSQFRHNANLFPVPNSKLSDPDAVGREQMFFHPGSISLGCVTFKEEIADGSDISGWKTELPQWYSIAKMLGYDPSTSQKDFIGTFLVHE